MLARQIGKHGYSMDRRVLRFKLYQVDMHFRQIRSPGSLLKDQINVRLP